MFDLSRLTRSIPAKTIAVLFAAGSLSFADPASARGFPGEVTVNVSYELQVTLPDDSLETLGNTLDQSSNMVYHRINKECEEMRKHFAESCKLIKLNVQNGRRSNRRQGDVQSVSLRANASFAVRMREPAE